MALRFYFVPKIGTGVFPDSFRAKYITALGVTYAARDYGMENAFLVGADVTDEQHVSISANLDVIGIPLQLGDTVPITSIAALQSGLEGMNIPALWITTTHTHRQVIAICGRVFSFMQKYHGMHRRKLFVSGRTLDTLWNQLPQAEKDAVIATANWFGANTSSITSTTTLRAVILMIAEQLPGFELAGETF